MNRISDSRWMRAVLWLSLSTMLSAQHAHLKKVATIEGSISPKSIVHNGKGLFIAQNMIYMHSVTVYNRKHQLLKTISDQVKLSEFGMHDKEGLFRGGPVEAAFSPDGSYAWVSNYRMSGKGYYRPAMDTCSTSDSCERSFLYKIDMATLKIVAVTEVGCVPKFLAISPDGQKMLVSNWCSGMVSVMQAIDGALIQEVPVGVYPRGIAINSTSTVAYIALMGSTSIVKMDLETYAVSRLPNIGNAPRHICMAPDDRHLYISLNGAHKVVRYNLESEAITGMIETGKHPRSMVLSKDGKRLYVANYKSNTLSKINTDSFSLMESIPTPTYPIGITFDDETREIWVAGYAGTLTVYKDEEPVKKVDLWNDLVHAFIDPPPKEEKITQIIPKEKVLYAIVVGSYSQPKNAEQQVSLLRAQGYEADIQESGDMYRVAIGEQERKEAEVLLKKLRGKINKDAWLLPL